MCREPAPLSETSTELTEELHRAKVVRDLDLVRIAVENDLLERAVSDAQRDACIETRPDAHFRALLLQVEVPAPQIHYRGVELHSNELGIHVFASEHPGHGTSAETQDEEPPRRLAPVPGQRQEEVVVVEAVRQQPGLLLPHGLKRIEALVDLEEPHPHLRRTILDDPQTLVGR